MGVLSAEVGLNFLGWVSRRVVDRLEGITDEEYLWEPVEGCWSLRPDADGVWRADTGADGRLDDSGDPPALTTIAWRMWHIGASPRPVWPPRGFRTGPELAAGWFGSEDEPGITGRHHEAPAIAAATEAVEALAETWANFVDEVRGLPDDELLTLIGPIGGPFAEATVLGLVLHIGDELVHHGAEIGLLRDLYRRR